MKRPIDKDPIESKNLAGSFQKVDQTDARFAVPEGSAPENGMVPDQLTATKIAEAVWLPIYGKDIYYELPFNAVLYKDSIWMLSGTLEKGWLGGTAFIAIRKKDGQILSVVHYK